MNNTLDHKCPKCDAVLKFNIEGQNFKCEYCRSEFNLEDLNVDKLSEENSDVQIDVYTCSNCGAEIIADINTSATSCIYCKNTAILKNKLEGIFNPDYLIPFKTTKQDAVSAFKKLSKGKWLMPKQFNLKRNIKDISGIYVPFWVYSYDSTGVIETESEKLSTWTSDGYRYTKTDKYKCIRGGNISFENILVNFSNNFNNEMLDTINPFDLTKMKCFEDNYYKDFLIEENIKNKDTITKEIQNKTKNYFKEEMKKDIKKYNQIKEIDSSINLYNLDISYILLPVWFLNIKHRKKSYMFLMNGQTGKINNNVPIDKTRIVFLWVSSFIIIFSLLILLSLIKVTL